MMVIKILLGLVAVTNAIYTHNPGDITGNAKDGRLLRQRSSFQNKKNESPLGGGSEEDSDSNNQSGIRIYETLDGGVELGVHHPSSITTAANVAAVSKRAALAYLSRHSGTGMTGLGGGTGGAFDYKKFETDLNSATENTLVRLFDSTKSALETTRNDVMIRHGFPSSTGLAGTGSTGSTGTTGTTGTMGEEMGGEMTGSTGSAKISDMSSTGSSEVGTSETGPAGPVGKDESNGSTGGSRARKVVQDTTPNAPLQKRKDLENHGHFKWLLNAGAGETDSRHQMLKGVAKGL